MKVSADFETRSPVDLKKHGAYVYFEHPQTEVLMCAYRIDDGPLQLWTYDQPAPADLCRAIEAGAAIHAWNANFEALGFDLLADRHGWPRPKIEQYVDTMAAAAAMSLPRALGDAAQALGLEIQKDKEGTRLIRKFSVPKRDGTFNDPKDHPEDWQKFCDYCRRDVEVEEAIARRIVPLSDAEQRLWTLNLKINRRGIRIDRQSAQSALAIAEKAKKLLDREMRVVTGGYVPACSQPGKLVEWVQAQGVDLSSAGKADIVDLLAFDDVPQQVRKALEIRQEAAKTSVSKLNAMLAMANDDGRVRGTSSYHAAGTGRFQSQGVNFNNMPRPRREFEEAHPRLSVLFDAFRREDPDWLKFLYGDQLGRPLHLISDAIRGFVWAGPGKEFIQADYSGIEGAVIAWLSGEDWKLKAMFDIINDPSIPDLYRQTAASILNLPLEVVTKKHWARQSVGKVSELACGFQGSVAAFLAMARNYNVNLDALYPAIWENADEEMRGKAVKRYEASLKRKEQTALMLSREAWLACWVIVQGWRAANPKIRQSWYDLEDAIRSAIQNPGTVAQAARTKYLVAKGFLWAQLPSGRCLAYGSPRLKDQVWAKRKIDGEWADAEVMEREVAEALERKGECQIQGATKQKVTALGVNSVTKKWERFALYGGLAQENNTQGTARDLLVNGMWKAEGAGYSVVATVYDEILAEVDRGFGDVREFERLICELPAWADGLPLTAGGWRGKRYRKE
ncbi:MULTISPECIES: DNA polymerase [unclassified Shinella]|uniref:DNA polymerase n=1 Tax=unclassified Shinella TaxID=2643062 RepID=UPI00225D82D3|nr:DNA polymerase [Rhizobiaceae bacterium]CAK7259129.1 DNA polymerase bacteriophage-type [Shinella sp. WSC3-e]